VGGDLEVGVNSQYKQVQGECVSGGGGGVSVSVGTVYF